VNKTVTLLAWLEEPRLLELLASLAAFGYGCTWLVVYELNLHYATHSYVNVFGPLAPYFAIGITLAGLNGFVATLKSWGRLRAADALVTFIGFGYFATYFAFAVPPLFIQIFIYTAWSLIEAIIFVRVINNLGGRWL